MTKPAPLRTVLTALVLLGAGIVLRPLLFADTATKLTRIAAQALSRQEWDAAARIAKDVLIIEPENSDAIAIAGMARLAQHRNEEAVSLLTRDVDHSKTTQLAVSRALARRYHAEGRLPEAEDRYREALELDPNDFESNRHYAKLLSFEGRCSEAATHLLAQIRHGVFLADELYLLGIPDELSVRDYHLRGRVERESPDTPLSQLAYARILVADHKLTTAEPIVRRIVDRYPHLPLAQALLGKILVEGQRVDESPHWHENLPSEVANSPEVWFVRGLWARQTDQPEAAVRCLLETLRTVPNHVEANYQLSQQFQKLGDVENAEFFSERSLLLSQLGYVVNDLRGEPNLRLMQQAVDAFELLGRHWEAVGWCELAGQFGGEAWAPQRLANNRRAACRDAGQVAAYADPVSRFSIEDYPLPTWEASKASAGPTDTQSDSDFVRFENEADESGLKFQYFNSMDQKVGLEHIFQTTGGGIAVLDFDGDMWPDLYFGNGKVLPESVEDINLPQSLHLDALFRNRGDGTFSLVTKEASLGDDGFTQGVTAGDFDNDGFQDVFVGNVGANRLYRNNGDGTFSETSNTGTTNSSEWTMSAMIADVDDDGLSDLYVVNYLDMAEVFDRSCKKDGEPLTCAPTLFSAEQDRLYRNRGDGTFEDVTEPYGIIHPNGKGLGIVGLRVEGRRGLQLFIANDTTENLYYETNPPENGETFYRENAVLAGVAMSESGDMQACMGVAAGDVDGDGNVDLFVTNFFADSNTMYLQTIPGTFTDSTRNFELAQPAYGKVGFGTQFLDANLDGHLDVIVTNGHVDQTFATGEPDRMVAQFFLNVDGQKFTEQNARTLGPFFAKKFFGRSLARLDWNRDGKDDACIIHLNEPVALLSNTTETSNRAIVLHLRGTGVSRDAVGATVKLQTQHGMYVRQLTGGDGYQALNQKTVTLGLLSGSEVIDFRVSWPDGSEDIIALRPANTAEMFVIQGKGAFPL